MRRFLRLSWPFLPLAVGLGPETRAATGDKTQFNLVNSSKHTIRSAQVSPAKKPDWGVNLLAGPLSPGKSISLTFEGGCGKYDIRFVVERGAQLEDEDLQFCGDGDTLTIGDVTLKKTKPSP